MLIKNSKGLSVCLAILAVLGAIALFQSTSVANEPQKDTAAPAAAVKIDVTAAMQDRVLGNPDAPITVIEYASLTCPHCAHFALNVLPKVKEKFIVTGKVKIIFRDFPMDAYGLKASAMARCLPEDKYFNMLEVIFNNQARWTSNRDPLEALAQLGALAGMDHETFKACTENKDLETALLAVVKEAQEKWVLESTPTFIFNNGEGRINGAQDIDVWEEQVAKLTKGK